MLTIETKSPASLEDGKLGRLNETCDAPNKTAMEVFKLSRREAFETLGGN